ncbi:YopJ family acetyltransferase [Xenorhabdus budapestensis]|uniref:YopJ family acetyltransferase n=1 Tax=Xenorhabdus budapestensis TaxID=290110 RepID=UPI003A866AB8
MLNSYGKTEISEYLSKINKSLEKREQISQSDILELHDKSHILYMVDRINKENKGVNIKVVNDVSQFPVYIENMIDNKENSARFIVFVNDRVFFLSHAVVFDCYHFKNRGISILGIESGNSRLSDFPLEMAKRCEKLNFNNVHNKVSLHILSTRQQNSGTECMIYSLALAKMLFKEREKLLSLHEKNLNDDFEVEETIKSVVKQSDTDKYLLPSLMKHCQSTRRVNEYLSTELDRGIFGNLNKNTYVVNKLNETLLRRHERTLTSESIPVKLNIPGKNEFIESNVIRRGITYNNSIFLKRKRDIEKLLGIYKK